jgi:hypothetical protein
MVCLLEIMSQGHFNHAESPRSSPDLTGWAPYAIKRGAEPPLNIKTQNSYSFIQTKAN